MPVPLHLRKHYRPLCCVGFEQYKNQQMREMDGPEARRKAEQVFGRLCWKDAWEELREVRDR